MRGTYRYTLLFYGCEGASLYLKERHAVGVSCHHFGCDGEIDRVADQRRERPHRRHRVGHHSFRVQLHRQQQAAPPNLVVNYHGKVPVFELAHDVGVVRKEVFAVVDEAFQLRTGELEYESHAEGLKSNLGFRILGKFEIGNEWQLQQ